MLGISSRNVFSPQTSKNAPIDAVNRTSFGALLLNCFMQGVQMPFTSVGRNGMRSAKLFLHDVSTCISSFVFTLLYIISAASFNLLRLLWISLVGDLRIVLSSSVELRAISTS